MAYFSAPNNPDAAIITSGLSKTYKGSANTPPKDALKSVDLTIPRGSFFGLLGPNGAGKSTLINILAGLVVKSAGSASIWGYDADREMRAARRCIGVVPQELHIDPFFTPRETLELQAGLYGIPEAARRTDEVLDAVGLSDKADAYARSLSGGMRRRLLVGKAMVHSPPVLVLDEPSAGVDVDLRRQLWAHVKRMNAAGTTVLLTTHYLEEAEAMCDTIAIINHGRLIACESTPDLLGRLDAKEMLITVDQDLAAVPETLAASLAGHAVELETPRRLRIAYPPSSVTSGQILAAVSEAGLEIIDVTTREADLEDIFLNLTRDPEHIAGDAA
ncbi:MAG: ABC transporter ATP-binding protein [Rhodospirillaceae bacterium]|nr:ABC transporter ATP-binding protein [Rhodospirillaceae bacterium]